MLKFFLFLIILETVSSFYLRINFWPLYQKFGFYQGDIWYFFYFYGHQIQNSFFFPIEYPVGFILIQKLAYFLSVYLFNGFNYTNFMLSHAVLMTPAVVALVLISYRICQHLHIDFRKSLFFLILSPSLFIYSTINYDILPAFFVLAAILASLSHRVYLAFFLLSLGTSIKIYPAFLIPIFILFFLKKEKFQQIGAGLALFVATLLFINLPFFLYNKDYFIFPYIYQITNNPARGDPTTISFWLFNLTGLKTFQGILLPILILISWAAAFIFYKLDKLQAKNFILLSLLGAFSAVFGNQLYSPQYILWFFPILVLTQVLPIALWWPVDLVNASLIFFYFKLKGEWIIPLYFIWSFIVIYNTFLYILLIANVKKIINSHFNFGLFFKNRQTRLP